MYLYNSDDHKIGKYYVGGVYELPARLEGNNLIFDYRNDRCNRKTSINFHDSIPNEIFINCTPTGGDSYKLDTSD